MAIHYIPEYGKSAVCGVEKPFAFTSCMEFVNCRECLRVVKGRVRE